MGTSYFSPQTYEDFLHSDAVTLHCPIYKEICDGARHDKIKFLILELTIYTILGLCLLALQQ